MNLFDNIVKTPQLQFTNVDNQIGQGDIGTGYGVTNQSTFGMANSMGIPTLKTTGTTIRPNSVEVAPKYLPGSRQYNVLKGISDTAQGFFGQSKQGAQELSQMAQQHAQKVTNKAYRDEEKVKKVVESLINAGFTQETINETVKKLDAEGKFQGSWSQSPVSGTFGTIESGLSKGVSALFGGVGDLYSAPMQDTSTEGLARFTKGTLGTGLGSAQLATSVMPTAMGAKALVAPAVNTLFSTDTAGKVLEPISKGIETGVGMGQSALGFNPESSLSRDIQQIGSTAGNLALFAGAQKGGAKAFDYAKQNIAPKVQPFVTKAGETITKPFSGVKETITRKVPVGIMERDLSLTPTERANIENINGKPAGAVALEYNLPKDKQAMADTLSTKADDAYNGITSDLRKVTARTESLPAKEMLGIMLDEMSSSKILSRTMKPYMDKLNQLLSQSDYSLSEKNAIRRDFDRIVANKIFDSKGRVSGIEDKAIANIREGLSSELQSEALKYGIDIKAKNDILRTSIALRDGVLRRLSQENKNNKIGLQDIGVGAILSAGEPLTAAGIIFGKKLLESQAPSIAQRLYSSNKTPYANTNLKRGVTITPRDTTNGLSITPDNGASVRIPVEVKKPTPKKVVTKLTPKEQNDIKLAEKGPMSIPLEVSNPALAKKVNTTPVKEVTPKKIKDPTKTTVNLQQSKGGFIKIPEIGKKSILDEFNNFKGYSDGIKGKSEVMSAIEDIGGIDNVKRTTLKITDIKPTESYNTANEGVKRVMEEIKSGNKIPVIVDEIGEIIDGNHRYAAYKALGITDIPVISPKNIRIPKKIEAKVPTGKNIEIVQIPNKGGYKIQDENGYVYGTVRTKQGAEDFKAKTIEKKGIPVKNPLVEEARKIGVDINKYFENVSEKSAMKMADYASDIVSKKMIKGERPMNMSELGMLSNKINKNEAGGNITTVGDIIKDSELRKLYEKSLDTPITILDERVAKKGQLGGYVPMGEGRYGGHIVLFGGNKEISNNLPKSILHEAAHAIRDSKGRKLAKDYRISPKK